MWNKKYEALSNSDKNEFRRIANYLLSHTYLNRYKYNPSEELTLPNKDYQLAIRLFSLLKEFFYITGWQLENDDVYGFMSLINKYDNNRFRIEQFTTLFLYTCRLIYEEQREQSSSFHSVLTNTHDILSKMSTLGLLKNGKSTQKERLEAQRALAHFNIIEKMETTAWEPDGNRILILPSILSIISNQNINNMMREIEELQIEMPEPEDNKEDAE